MLRRLREDHGAILMWMSLMIVVFLAFAALAVDLGMAYAVKRQLSATADSTSLAGAQEAGLVFKSTNGCPGGVPDPALVAAVNAAVADNHAANAPWGSTGAPTPTIECDETQVTVRVEERSDLSTFFARTIGVTSLSPAAKAAANVFGSNYGGGLRPFTICVEDAIAGAASTTTTMQSVYVRHNSGGGPTPGGETLVQGGSTPWTESDERIDAGSNMGLAIGDYVRLDIQSGATGASDGYYWVQDTPANQKWITVSTTLGGSAVNVTEDGVVDVYAQPTPVSGGNSNWDAANDTITANSHGLSATDYVWIAIRNGAAGATSGYYYVKDVPSPNTLTVTTSQGGTAQDITTNGSVDIYTVGSPSSTLSCQPTGAPGNWGYASFGLGSSQTVLKCLIEFGYNGGPDCPGTPTGTDLGELDGDPPVSAPGNTGDSIESTPDFRNKLTALVDTVILLPVAADWIQSGSNANYDARGGAAVQVCGFAFPKNNNDATPTPLIAGGCWNQTLYDQFDADGKLQDASLILQWRYVSEYTGTYIGQGSSSGDTCALGDETCIPVVRLVE